MYVSIKLYRVVPTLTDGLTATWLVLGDLTLRCVAEAVILAIVLHPYSNAASVHEGHPGRRRSALRTNRPGAPRLWT
jgi:hypothetical protein